MSQPPPKTPWSTEPAQPGAPGFAVPAQPLQYVMAVHSGRPGLITAIGVISIVVASLSVIGSLFGVLQAGGYYMMSVMSSTVAASQARAAAAAARPPTTLPMPTPGAASDDAPAVGSGGIEAPERASAVAALSARQPLTPLRKRHLDTILALAGLEMGIDDVTESGTMPEMRSGELPPDYFVTRAGRLEVYDDRAVFFPSNNSPTVRASAPPPDRPAAPSPPAVISPARRASVEVQPPVEIGDAGAEPSSPPAADSRLLVPATSPATALATAADGAAPMPGALTPAEIQSVVQQAQSLAGNGLNAAQVTSLQAVLSGPGQQLVQAGAAEGSVASAYAPAGSPAAVAFIDGGSVTIAPTGNVTAMAAAPVMPTIRIQPVSLGLMVATAVASLALAVYLLVCGIATLRQSPRARRLHLVYSAIKIPLAVTAGVSAAWVTRDMIASFGGTGALVGFSGFSLFSGLAPIVMGCAYPVALLIALNLKSVREYYAFDGGRATGHPVAG